MIKLFPVSACIGLMVCVTSTSVRAQVGVGIPTPLNTLHISKGGGITAAPDVFTPADSIALSGIGTRFFWAPAKQAFRAGQITAYRPDFWDNEHVGFSSFGFGSDIKIKGAYSSSFGLFNETDGQFQYVYGNNNMVGIGYPFSQGNFVNGSSNNVFTSDNTVFGGSNELLIPGGNGRNLVHGLSNKVENEQNVILGSNNIARAIRTYSFGSFNILRNDGQVVVGTSNDTTDFTQSYGKPFFQVANPDDVPRFTNMMVTSVGNVGIHVHEPLARLHVDGPIIIGDNQGAYSERAGMIRYNNLLNALQYNTGAPNNTWHTIATQGNGGSGGSGWGLSGNAISSNDFIGSTNAVPVIIKSDNTERIRVDDNGFIGINESVPSARLHVKSSNLQLRMEGTSFGANAGMVLAPQANNSTNRWEVYGNTSLSAPYGNFKIRNPGVGGELTFTSEGKLGLGTTTPEYPLHVKGAGTQLAIESTTSGTASTILFKNSADIGNWLLSGTNNTNAPYGMFRIAHSFSGGSFNMTDAGRIGVNTITPEAFMDVRGASSTAPQMQLMDVNSGYAKLRLATAGITSRAWDISGLSVNPGGQYDLFKISNNGIDGITLDGNGMMGLNTSTPIAYMDVRGVSSGVPLLRLHSAGGGNSRLRMSGSTSSNFWEINTLVTSVGGANDKFRINNSASGDLLTIDATGNTAIAGGGGLSIAQTGGLKTIQMTPSEAANQGALISLYNNSGTKTIEIDADWGVQKRGRIILDEIQIKGGSDFAEDFTMVESGADEALPGMLVSIDEHHEGQLSVTSQAYDPKIAGVISGANGVSTGMRMGQAGTLASGDMPVALAGRVYILTTEEGGEIKPGDFITSSSKKGYAMKTSHDKAHGAIIGKAMTRRDPKTGYVLVLINLQ